MLPGSARPHGSFAPALSLRKRTHANVCQAPLVTWDGIDPRYKVDNPLLLTMVVTSSIILGHTLAF
jgi:hypothetical protein